LRGKELMYALCRAQGIAHRNTKKWIVAQDEQQLEAINQVHDFAKSIGVPTRFLSKREAVEREPDVRAEAGVLESPTTGIVDSHGLMAWLEGTFVESLGGTIAFHTAVTGLERDHHSSGKFRISTADFGTSRGPSQEAGGTIITAETVINSAGLFAVPVSNMLLPPSRHLIPYYAKGTYFSYSAPFPKPSTLIYPAPVPGHGGLGTHLTLDLSNPPRIRFGPDVEWVDSPTDYTPNRARLKAALDEIETYLPGLRRDCVEVDYCGIRPKLSRQGAVSSGGKGFQDFVIRQEEGFNGFVNLLGIESPGLTSSLAIAEEVDRLLYK
jgi:L-2-hydroxyglutarate oxidase LhgO